MEGQSLGEVEVELLQTPNSLKTQLMKKEELLNHILQPQASQQLKLKIACLIQILLNWQAAQSTVATHHIL